MDLAKEGLNYYRDLFVLVEEKELGQALEAEHFQGRPVELALVLLRVKKPIQLSSLLLKLYLTRGFTFICLLIIQVLRLL